MPADLFEVNTNPLLNAHIGPAMLFTAPIGTAFPTAITDVLNLGGLTPWVPKAAWTSLGATKTGIKIERGFTKVDRTSDQSFGAYDSRPNNWTTMVSTEMLETTPTNLAVAWEGSPVSIDASAISTTLYATMAAGASTFKVPYNTGIVASDVVLVDVNGLEEWFAVQSVAVGAAAGAVASVAVGAGGTGYTSPPTVGFTGGAGSGAAATAVLTSGVVTSITITNPGTGYTSPPTVGFTGGGGSGATATATLGPVPDTVTLVSGEVSAFAHASGVAVIRPGQTSQGFGRPQNLVPRLVVVIAPLVFVDTTDKGNVSSLRMWAFRIARIGDGQKQMTLSQENDWTLPISFNCYRDTSVTDQYKDTFTVTDMTIN